MNQKTNDPADRHPVPETEPPATGESLVPADPGEPGDRDDPPLEHDTAPSDPPPTSDDRPPSDTTTNEPGPPPPAAAPTGRGMALSIALLALLLALLSLAAAGYLWWSSRDSGSTAAANAAAIDRVSGTVDDVRGSLAELGERIEELDASGTSQANEIAALEEQFEDAQDRMASLPGRLSSLESSMASLQGISAGTRDTWLLAEAEYYLQIANAQLQLAGNPERALLALRFADQRIRQLADPALSEVRRALASELRAVEAMEKPDLQGISMTLASLAESVESLPLEDEATVPGSAMGEPPADASGWDRAVASVKAAFSDIVTVRRTDEEVTPLMSPEAAYFLRANLALKLQTARLALLRGEQAIFEQSLADASAWLRGYYVNDARAVQSALQTLSELREANFTVTPPDISGSLRLLREFQQRNADDAPRLPADEPAQ